MVTLNSLRKILVSCTFVCAAAACSPTTSQIACDGAELQQRLRLWLESIMDYRLLASVTLDDVKSSSTIIGKKPDRMRIDMELTTPDGLIFYTVVFDGTYQWVETRVGSDSQVVRLTVSELTTADKPFDTGYYLNGSGLLNGEDFPSSILALLYMYDLKADCSGGRKVLSGPVNIENVQHYISVRGAAGRTNFNLEQFIDVFGYLILELNSENDSIAAYSLGSSPNDDGEFRVELLSIETGEAIKDSFFVYAPDPEVEVIDITDIVSVSGSE